MASFRLKESRYEELHQIQRYRRDRRELLLYVCQSGDIKKVIMPPGAVTLDDVDTELVNVDYVLECCKTHGTLDLMEAARRHQKDLLEPPRYGEGESQVFLLATDPNDSGDPPLRPPPARPRINPSMAIAAAGGATALASPAAVTRRLSSHHSLPAPATPAAAGEPEDDEFEEDGEEVAHRKLNATNELLLRLPPFQTGLTDDDFRETAFEVLLASVGNTGVLTPPPKTEEKKEKRRLLRRRSSKQKKEAEPQKPAGLAALLEIMRGQMEISEAVDLRIREGLLYAASSRAGRRVDTLLVPLELLSSVPPTQFASKREYVRWEKRQLNVLLEGLVLHPAVPLGPAQESLANNLKRVIARLEEAESMPSPAGPSQHVEAMRDLRGVATALAERSNRGETNDEVCHWADGYPLNVRIYEQLLRSCFDVLDETQLVDEVEDILELLKGTWRILGITPAVHDVCWAWVVFRQFVLTKELELLQSTAQHLKKMASDGGRSAQERAYMQLMRTVSEGGGPRALSWVQSTLAPIKDWADTHLTDYHKEFPEGALGPMESLLGVAIMAGRLLAEEDDTGAAGWGMQNTTVAERAAMVRQTEEYVRSSLKAAYARAAQAVERQHGQSRTLPLLAALARQVRDLAREEAQQFSPVLIRWSINARAVAAAALHQQFKKDLAPYLQGISTLTDEAAAILPAAEALETYLLDMAGDAAIEAEPGSTMDMTPFGVGDVSATLIMRWVNGQLVNLTQMVERSLVTEVWDPLSAQQRYAGSIVEVVRIMEETLDQFFALQLPMRGSLLRGLSVGIDGALTLYSSKVVSQIGAREDLIPPPPPLTRFKKDVTEKTLEKAAKKPTGGAARLDDDQRQKQIDGFTVPRLCVRLNTLHYVLGQLEGFEGSIRERWLAKHPNEPVLSRAASAASSRRTSGYDAPPDAASTGSARRRSSGSYRTATAGDSAAASADWELFMGTRRSVNSSIERICDFLGTKVVFWDLRGPLLEELYRPTVAASRIDKIVGLLDPVLASLCEVIAAQLRDRAVLSLLQATLEGLQRVLLDGGQTRAFLRPDADAIEDDLSTLKDFFVAEGDGLPRATVEKEASLTTQILHLFSLETPELVENFQTASKEMVSGGGKAPGRSATDADTLLRVLCHRADRDASKFLKKSYKLPKTVG